jgi:pimeloyl-ACP methyl ester carboxylesterase
VPALAGGGFRVVAPDQRGFGASDRPAAVDAYEVRHAVADALAVLDALDVERAHVVGHDWGAGVAWALAAFAPERVDRLAVLSVGHPRASGGTVAEREKAWYQLWFLFEGVAEELLPRDDWRLLHEFTRGNGDVARYVEDLARPGALAAGLNWYRANVDPRREVAGRLPFPDVAGPVLGIWSSGDDYLLEEPMLRSGAHVRDGWRYERIEGASHWPQLDVPDRVNALLLDFLS